MSVRFEYASASNLIVEYVNEQALPVENPDDQNVIVLNYDEAFVITGSPEELTAFADRIKAAVAAGPLGWTCEECGNDIPGGTGVSERHAGHCSLHAGNVVGG